MKFKVSFPFPGLLLLHAEREVPNESELLKHKYAHVANISMDSGCRTDNITCIQTHMSLRVHLNADTLVETLNDQNRANRAVPGEVMEKFGVTYHQMNFEDLMAGEAGSIATVNKSLALHTWNGALAFLGEPRVSNYEVIAGAIGKTNLAPTHPTNQCDVLDNADEVRSTLAGTPHEWMLGC